MVHLSERDRAERRGWGYSRWARVEAEHVPMRSQGVVTPWSHRVDTGHTLEARSSAEKTRGRHERAWSSAPSERASIRST